VSVLTIGARAAALRRALDAAGYDEQRLREALRLRGRFVAPLPTRRGLYVERLHDDDAFGTLVRLFLLALPVPLAAAGPAFGELDLHGAVELGLVRVEDGTVHPLVRITPFDGLHFVAESAEWDDATTPSDIVPGLSEVGVTIARLTPRSDCASVLDLATGFGLHGLLVSRHAERVIGTDINPRALGFARLNAELNGIENVEFLEGDLFEPVRGERFDLIVANPPFVVSPDRRYVFRDGGPDICERVLAGAAAALVDGGVAVVAVGWPHDGVDRCATPSGWLDGLGCDAVILRLADLDLLSNGWTHTRDAGVTARWASELGRAGIAGAGYGVVALRRRAGGGRVTTIDLLGADTPTAGFHLLRILRNLEWLAENDAQIEAAPLAAADGLELRRVEQLGASGDPPRPDRLALRRGLPVTAEVDAAVLDAIARGSAAGDPTLAPKLRELFELGLVNAP
jgi:hypothetical protein